MSPHPTPTQSARRTARAARLRIAGLVLALLLAVALAVLYVTSLPQHPAAAPATPALTQSDDDPTPGAGFVRRTDLHHQAEATVLRVTVQNISHEDSAYRLVGLIDDAEVAEVGLRVAAHGRGQALLRLPQLLQEDQTATLRLELASTGEQVDTVDLTAP